MKVKLTQNDHLNFVATTGNGHCISMDGAPSVGGGNKGARPMEVVLSGLGGCSAIDVMLILQKSRQSVRHCEIEINAQRAETIPNVFTHIHLHYRLTGDQLDPKKIARAIDLSKEKYCSVTKMLENTAEISSSFEIVGP